MEGSSYMQPKINKFYTPFYKNKSTKQLVYKSDSQYNIPGIKLRPKHLDNKIYYSQANINGY